ncbi:MAG TPA: outer membrane beta-barrel protein [Vicinamibacterales bacterium]|nr:outer membrane beta-barrel protein [Vicinamibacterales bacterium]
MKRAAVTILIACGVFMGTANQAFAQGATWADRGYINVGWGVESGSSTMTDTRTFTIYDEPATVTSASSFTSGSLFDVGVGIRVWRNLTVGAGYHQEQNDTDAELSGSVPSPVFFNRPRTLTGSEPLDRKEMATHLNIGWVVPINDKFDVQVSAGPSFFRLTQDVVSNVSPNESSASGTSIGGTITVAERKKSVTGYNVGAEATYIVWSNDSVRVGVGGFVRFSQADTTVTMQVSDQPTTVGGAQFGFGGRLRF